MNDEVLTEGNMVNIHLSSLVQLLIEVFNKFYFKKALVLKKITFLIILFSAYTSQMSGQSLKGLVTEDNGAPLPYVNIYIKGTSTGTTTNFNGEFELAIPEGAHEIIFQYLGYKKHYETVDSKKLPELLLVQLTHENIRLGEVVITPGAEDPAYAIIRKAIEMRKYYLGQIEEYTCNSYTKGIIRMDEAPDSLFGESMHEKDDSLKGIIYLSESESKLFFTQPDDMKEYMVSSRVSGDNKGFSFNFISFFLMNFYKNNVSLPIDKGQRGFISPVSSNAFFYYSYRLEGAFVSGGLMVNKIKVIPKRKSDPVFSGYIYILDDSWRIQSVDLTITKHANIDFIDSVQVKQNMVALNDTLWVNFSQQFHFFFSIKFFSAKFRGNGIFHSQFTDYIFKNETEKKFAKSERIIIDKDANKKDSLFWLEKRAIPLTVEEVSNYKKKDSLEIIYNSKEYLDSTDKKYNKFKAIKLLTGYSYSNRYDSLYIWTDGLTNMLNFNTVQGLNIYLGVGYRKNLPDERYYSISPRIGYGFSNKSADYKLETDYFYNRDKFAKFSLEGGKITSQFNENNPVSPLDNTFYTLLCENNYMKVYEKKYIKIRHKSEVTNGVYINMDMEYAERGALLNTTNYKWIDRSDREYTSNDPLAPLNLTKAFPTHQGLIFEANIHLTFRQNYLSLPYKSITGSKYPRLSIYYKKGIPTILGSDINFDLLELSIYDKVKMGLFGITKYKVSYGKFITKKSIRFIDYKHFNANRTLLANNRLDAFQLLDYYTYSTPGEYIEGHYEHHFNGFLVNKIPLLKKTKLRTVGGAHFLYNNENKEYFELSLGFENIFKLGRFDFVTSFNRNQNLHTGFVLRLPINTGKGSVEVAL